MGEGLIGHVAVSGKPFISPDVRKEPRYINARSRTRSEMVAPIISNEEVIGVFDLESDELNAYAKDDLEVLGLLASQEIGRASCRERVRMSAPSEEENEREKD